MEDLIPTLSSPTFWLLLFVAILVEKVFEVTTWPYMMRLVGKYFKRVSDWQAERKAKREAEVEEIANGILLSASHSDVHLAFLIINFVAGTTFLVGSLLILLVASVRIDIGHADTIAHIATFIFAYGMLILSIRFIGQGTMQLSAFNKVADFVGEKIVEEVKAKSAENREED